MNQKPTDLFLNIIDFFGIFIPGAVLAVLDGDFLLRPFELSMRTLQTFPDWVPAFFVSYVLGHFLLGFSVPLNQLATRFPSNETKAYYNDVCSHLKLPPEISNNLTNVFYRA